MSQPWSPEIAITIQQAKHIIEAQFPQLKPLDIDELGKGFDNTVFHVNNRYVFRFPRKEIAVQLLNIENKLLPLLVKDLNIPIPEPIFWGKPTNSFKWPFTGYHLVKGHSPGKLSNEVRSLSAAPLAEFLKRLHQFPIEEAEKIGLPDDRFGRMDFKKRMPILIDNIKKAAILGLINEDVIALQWLHLWQDTPMVLSKQESLVHGDFHIRNILVDEKGIVSGVIDWGDTHIGNPSIDLSIAYSFLPPSTREEFFRVYGEVSEGVRSAAKFFALYVSTILILYGHDVKDERLVASAQESFKLALS